MGTAPGTSGRRRNLKIFGYFSCKPVIYKGSADGSGSGRAKAYSTAHFSVPKRSGVHAALWLSASLHLTMLIVLVFLFWKEGLGTISFLGLTAVGLLLAYEHSLVRPADLSRANTAFFTINGWISILLFATTMIDLLWNGTK